MNTVKAQDKNGSVLPAPLAGKQVALATRAGEVMVYHDQPENPEVPVLPPLLLVHSVNAAGTAAEMAPLYRYYGQKRAVYAMDLPGFGLSDRSDRRYTVRLMTDAVLDVIEEIRRACSCPAVDVLGLSLSSEYVVRAQLESPRSIRRLALVSPTGFNGKPRRYGPPGSSLGVDWLYRIFANPLWSEGLYRLLTRPEVIRYFLQRSWGSQQIDETLWRYDVLTTRAPGAKYAPLFFLSAYLFSKDINRLYETLTCPVWVSMATRGDFKNYSGRSTVEGRSNWQFHKVDGGALPYFEDLSAFVALLDPFWAAPD